MLKICAFILQCMPLSISLKIGWALGWLGYFIFPRKTRTIYLNLKTVFGCQRTHAELKEMTRRVYCNTVCSFIELLCFPKIKKQGFEKYVTLLGRENIDAASNRGKGVIFVAMHSGNWELASVIGSVYGLKYHLVANRQSKMPQLDALLNENRKLGGASVLVPGEDTKEILQAIKRNEILSIVIDQGGRDGMIVPFLGKPASLSTGAIRLALKYGCAICPIWMNRTKDGHVLTVYPALDIQPSGNESKDIALYLNKICAVIEPLLKKNPYEYLWFYKVFKYTNRIDVLICEDGRTGHLRQSQAVAHVLTDLAECKNKKVVVSSIPIKFRHPYLRFIFNCLVWLSYGLRFLRGRWLLVMALDQETLKSIEILKPDMIISCGSMNASFAWMCADLNRAKTIAILKQGMMPLNAFDRIIMPLHDGILNVDEQKLIRTKVAPNLINQKYMKTHEVALLSRYSHLKNNVHFKIGVLIGGDAKGVSMRVDVIRQLLIHLKNACHHYNATCLITTSRRTPQAIDALIAHEMASFQKNGLCIIANHHNIAEAVGGILSLSDLLIVSGESVSMVSEAVSSGKRTLIFSPTGDFPKNPSLKYDRFCTMLSRQGYALTSSIKDIPANISLLMSQKIVFKKIDDHAILIKGLQGII